MMSATPLSPPDAIELTQRLIQCETVTPAEGGAMVLLEQALAPFGFNVERIDLGDTPNLYARWGDAAPVFCFGGHTDVVPLGDEAAWSRAPFGGQIEDGKIWGRGACDMKSGVAAFAAAACRFVAETPPAGSIAMLITGDEEADGTYGTRAVLKELQARGERFDHALVGEPTGVESLGDVVKIGRRGSITFDVAVNGLQGHVAYPDRAVNAAAAAARLADRVASAKLDDGAEHFSPSTLSVTTIDVGNPATNVVPGHALVRFNIRFNTHHTADTLTAWVRAEIGRLEQERGVACELRIRHSASPFLCPPGKLTQVVSAAVKEVVGAAPALTTGGGTSDARFIKDACPVIEVGLTGTSMHQVDEFALVDEIPALMQIYLGVLRRYFA